MTTALTTFNTPFASQLRVIDREGAPWFFAKDVCETLGMDMRGGTGRWTAGLRDDEKGSIRISVGTAGHPQGRWLHPRRGEGGGRKKWPILRREVRTSTLEATKCTTCKCNLKSSRR